MDRKEIGGILVVKKHSGVTSHDIVNQIRRLFETKCVGHTGTLDPMATGVLVVLVGRATKACEYVSSHSKRYLAGLRLGITTDTEDITGQVLTTSEHLPTREELMEVLPRFRGEIMQTPPMYSALKVNGKKLVDLARSGQTIERQARPITVFDLQATPTETPEDYFLDVYCSGGTYIRTLCADIGNALGCGGVMSSLQRVAAGDFTLEQGYTVEELKDMSIEQRYALLLPTEQLFADCAAVCLPAFYEKLCRNGCEIYLKKLKYTLPVGARVRICDEGGRFFALGEVREYADGPAVKAIKSFSLS